uniref:Antitoxin Phd_YefM, type II toxin-antitoxin system n=1 Tax=Candidatus Kentrum sp. TUN TaxID=2126343 RepID=A0A450ZNX5_9GAMM|nr:MAG: Antitoxin Phd_YefM, type II toxin-antitoxin system [Candidatus Kentron sp. TUN]VFK55272.1 MAG: Antitoxin Phd_YefM, type II toxin-antitoxin system [Candidatus Kentron sp. TUN]VFK55440.1 MAG: Antitoxin Phd_YefM, type II toxin-antitoxin system [Candidatus Kentron sp. TUN]
MNTVSIQNAIEILPDLVRKTIEDCEETVIVSNAGAVVLINQREWESMLETVRFFQDKTSLRALLDGHKSRKTGDPIKANTIEEVFHDLQNTHPEKCE